jgi:hypothetical protein
MMVVAHLSHSTLFKPVDIVRNKVGFQCCVMIKLKLVGSLLVRDAKRKMVDPLLLSPVGEHVMAHEGSALFLV